MSAPPIRYDRLQYVALNVSDLERAKAFYINVVGLQSVAGGPPDSALLRCNHSHHDLLLLQAAEPGLKRVSWRMQGADDLERLVHHLRSIGVASTPVASDEAAALGLTEAVRFVEPTTGATFELTAGCSGEGDFTPTHTKILRLGHVVLRSSKPRDTVSFFLDHLNFRASDHIDGAVTFMRCFPNPLHHSCGISTADRPGLHHVNFMVSDIDDIGRAIHRFKREGVKVVYGPGRHPPSESVFLYFLEPDGMTLEYSFGMEEFPELAPRSARTLPLSLNSVDYWGAVPEPEMAKVGSIDSSPERGATP